MREIFLKIPFMKVQTMEIPLMEAQVIEISLMEAQVIEIPLLEGQINHYSEFILFEISLCSE